MGMAGPDIVLFVAGLLLLGGAGYALVATGDLGGGSPTNVFTVTWPVERVEVERQNVGDFGSAALVFDVKQTNVSTMVVSVTCNDAVPGGTFNLQIRIEPPGGIKADPKAVACAGKTDIEIPVAALPPATAAQGNSAESARASIPMDANATRAVGEWKITINGARAGGVPGLPAGNPGGSVALLADAWAPELAAVVK